MEAPLIYHSNRAPIHAMGPECQVLSYTLLASMERITTARRAVTFNESCQLIFEEENGWEVVSYIFMGRW